MFFDKYPRFYETSLTGPDVVRLNLRHHAIFGENLDAFPGARVLDIASHDGRWSFAALRAGAAEVIGIEAREDLVEHARESFRHYGVAGERFHFIAGDVFEVMANERPKVDVVLCLGFLYHTLRYSELLHLIRSTGAHTLFIDTEVTQHQAPVVRLRTENIHRQGNATPDRYSVGERVVVGSPSRTALTMMLGAYGFTVERESDWASILRDNRTDPTVRVYADGKRITVRCRATGSPH
jgi:protein-L-isoaspartate O-methyltransferase